jgi:hypothetical protein
MDMGWLKDRQTPREVWVCSENGEVDIYNKAGKTDNSEFFGQLPKKFEI